MRIEITHPDFPAGWLFEIEHVPASSGLFKTTPAHYRALCLLPGADDGNGNPLPVPGTEGETVEDAITRVGEHYAECHNRSVACLTTGMAW